MYVDESRCVGCGACLQVCPSNAIRLMDDMAQIDAMACNDCRACVDVCLSEAITAALPVIIPATRVTCVPMACAQILPTSTIETKPVTTGSRVIAPALGAALTFIGREIVPRVASAIVETMLKHPEEKPSLPPVQNIRPERQRRLRQRMRGTER
jgi:ferredoxin